MKITIQLPYPQSELYYEKWAHSEDRIDFEQNKLLAERCTIAYAAEELQQYLTKLGHEVSVSDKKGAYTIELYSKGQCGEAFEISADKDTLFLCGDSRCGVLYAAYEVLEAQGIRWYTPTEEYVPPVGTAFVVPDCRRYVYDMPIGRGFHPECTMKESSLLYVWMARNRLNLHACHPNTKKLQQKLCMTFINGGHVFEKLLNPFNIAADGRYYIDAHRDWYGKRVEPITAENAQEVQFCVTNNELLDALADTVIEHLQHEWADLDVLELAGFDTWGASCTCAACERLGNGSDKNLHFLSHIRTRVDEAIACGKLKHNVHLAICAYEGTNTIQPPQNPFPKNLLDADDRIVFSPILRCYQHDMADPTCDRNRDYQRHLQGWLRTGVSLTVNEYYNVSKFEDLPLLFDKRIRNDVRSYIRMGTRGMMYMHVPMVEWGVRTLNHYLLAHIARDANCDNATLINKYFSDLYGAYAERVKAVYQDIEIATETCASWRSWSNQSVLTHLMQWDGKLPNAPLYRDSHLGATAVTQGEHSVELLQQALSTMRSIRFEVLENNTPAPVTKLAVNPQEQAKAAADDQLLSRLNEDIRGLVYGVDMYRLLTLFLAYHEALYARSSRAQVLWAEIDALAMHMVEYTNGITFEAYKPVIGQRDALKRSQLQNVYYRCRANRHDVFAQCTE